MGEQSASRDRAVEVVRASRFGEVLAVAGECARLLACILHRPPIILPVRLRCSMSELATTRMSSRGQVVIPDQIRRKLGLEPGAQFIAVGEADVVILKRISKPSLDDFGALVAEARRQARRAGMKRSDVRAAVQKARSAR